ncbi:MAG TPA: hypothetical protein VF642_12260 [Propionibacteriaceae bacterium]|jgi:hypothetical protein
MRPVPKAQDRRFGLAVCERLGLDPALVKSPLDWEVVGGEPYGQIHFTVHLPAEEILAMFNGAAPIIAPE